MPQNFFDINSVITLGTILPSLGLGILVYLKGEKGLNKTIFVISSLVISLWALANFFSLQGSELLLFWVRAVIFFATLLVFVFFLFTYIFPEGILKLSKIKLIGFGLLAILTMISTMTPLIFRSINITDHSPIPTSGPLIPLFGFTVLFFFILGGINLVQKIKKSSSVEKNQLIFFAIGYFTMFALLITTQFLFTVIFKNTNFIKFGPLFTTPFLLLTTYAIFRHHLFSIRIIATELFTILSILVFAVNTLLSGNLWQFIINLSLLALITFFGILLIKGTLREIRELERLSEEKSNFVSIASHQLRSPLTAIKGFLSMIKEGSGDEQNRKNWLDKAYISNERLIRLVNDLLNIARIERGKIKYDFNYINLVDLLEDLIGDFREQNTDGRVELRWKKPDEAIPEILADEEKLRQVFLNLIDNAFKYTEKGWIAINIKYLKDLHRIKIVVLDTGIGMTKEDMRGLFEIFSRGEAGQKRVAEGTGLGLYVAREIIKAHNGHIWAESDGPQKGSKFYVELPVE